MNREEQIRQRAHQIWEEEGRPEGRDAEHWARAVQELDSRSSGPAPERQIAEVGLSTGLQPGGTTPGTSPGAGMGSIGTGGGSSGGKPTGNVRKAAR